MKYLELPTKNKKFLMSCYRLTPKKGARHAKTGKKALSGQFLLYKK
jgi:hypothetical protein